MDIKNCGLTLSSFLSAAYIRRVWLLDFYIGFEKTVTTLILLGKRHKLSLYDKLVP